MATANDTVTLFNGFSLDRTRGCLVHAGKPVHLRPQSFQVLEYLVNNAGQLISKDKLIEAVWHGRAVTDGAVGKCIEDLRVVFGEEGSETDLAGTGDSLRSSFGADLGFVSLLVAVDERGQGVHFGARKDVLQHAVALFFHLL